MTLVYLSSAFLAGIYLGSLLAPSLPLILLAAGIAALLVLVFYPERRKSILAILCLIALLLGLFRFNSSKFVPHESSVAFYNGSGTFEIKGMVAEDPEPKDTAINLRLWAMEMKRNEEWRRVSGVILVRLPQFPEYRYGDILKVNGRLEAPPQFSGFDYREYLARQGIHSVMRYPKVELLAEGQGFKPLEWVYELRRALSRSLAAILPEPQASLAQGMLLGIRTGIPEELNEAFSRTGTMHIVAISGHNISIVAGLFLIMGIYLFGRHRSFYFVFALAGIWLYALLSGMAPSVQRAVLMGSLWLTADFIGRPRSALTALMFSAAVLVGINPSLLWDVAFQLSFAAMGGLILISSPLEAMRREWNSTSGMGSLIMGSLAVTLGATLATMPIIAANFHRIPLVTIPANLVALPALPFIMAASAVSAGVGLLYLPLGQFLGWLAWPFLTYLITVAETFSALPLASVEIQAGDYFIPIYYLLMGAAIWVGTRWKGLSQSSASAARNRPSVGGMLSTRVIIVVLFLVCLAVWVPVLGFRDSNLQVSFLDVGQGDAILIQTPSHRKVLIDGGPSPQAINAQLGKRLPFWDRSIDMIILTHPDDDHITGLSEVLRRYRVRQAMDSGIKATSPFYADCLGLIKKGKVEYVLAQAGQRVELGNGITLEVLHPQAQFLRDTPSDVNNNSIVLRLASGSVSFLFTGDIEEEAQSYLLTRGVPLGSTVLKIPHHGAKRALSPDFLAAVSPQIAVISVGADNRFGHPARETLAKLNERLPADRVYLTEKDGTIDITMREGRMWVKTER